MINTYHLIEVFSIFITLPALFSISPVSFIFKLLGSIVYSSISKLPTWIYFSTCLLLASVIITLVTTNLLFASVNVCLLAKKKIAFVLCVHLICFCLFIFIFHICIVIFLDCLAASDKSSPLHSPWNISFFYWFSFSFFKNSFLFLCQFIFSHLILKC